MNSSSCNDPPEELAHIATSLGFIREGIDKKEFTISGDGTVKAASYQTP